MEKKSGTGNRGLIVVLMAWLALLSGAVMWLAWPRISALYSKQVTAKIQDTADVLSKVAKKSAADDLIAQGRAWDLHNAAEKAAGRKVGPFNRPKAEDAGAQPGGGKLSDQERKLLRKLIKQKLSKQLATDAEVVARLRSVAEALRKAAAESATEEANPFEKEY